MLRYHAGVSRDVNGDITTQASVRAFFPDTQTEIEIFSDESGSAPITQPLSSDSQGRYSFYTREPVIDLKFSKGLTASGYRHAVPLQVRQTPFVFAVDSFGAIADGLANDRDAIQAAIDAAAEVGEASVVQFTPGRTYYVEGSIRVKETVLIDLTGAIIEHKALSYGDGLFHCRPQEYFNLTWSTDIDVNAREFTEQDPPYSQGDYLLFTTDYDWVDRQYKYGNTHYGQSFLVERVDGNTVTLSDYFVQEMKAANGIQLLSFKNISPVIRGGEIRTDDSQMTGGTGPAVSYCLRFSHCKNPRVEGTKLRGLVAQYSAFIRFEHCYAPVASGVCLSTVNLDRDSDDGVYGIQFSGATSHGRCISSDGHGLRHMSDATFADLTTEHGSVVLTRICGVFWTAVKSCRAFDSVNSGFGPHGVGRFIDFIDCKSIGAGAGFSTRLSYTRFIDCHAASPGVASYAFDFGGGVQLSKDDTGNPSGDQETGAFGGQNALVGCELINCSMVGYKKGLFRLCNMSSLVVRDCNLELPTRLDGAASYYEFYGHFDYGNPRRWQDGWRYLPGDWVRDAWVVSEGDPPEDVWHYMIFECKETPPDPGVGVPYTPPHSYPSSNDYWARINGWNGRPSPIRGKLLIHNSRFLHHNSFWEYSGLHRENGIKGPVVFPEELVLENVEMSPARSSDQSGLRSFAFQARIANCVCRQVGGSGQNFAVDLYLPGSVDDNVMYIDSEIASAKVEIVNGHLEGSQAPWNLRTGSSGLVDFVGSNAREADGITFSGPVHSSDNLITDGSLTIRGGVIYRGYLWPNGGSNLEGNIALYDGEGGIVGYLRVYR